MSAGFAAGLFYGGWDLTPAEREEVVALVVEQAELPLLREPLGDRVLEVSRSGSRVTRRWLDPAALESVRALRGWSGAGAAVYAVVPEDCSLLLPGLARPRELRLALPDRKERRTWARDMADQARLIRERQAERMAELPQLTPRSRELSRSTIEAAEHGLRCIEQCLAHRVAISASWPWV